MAEVDAVRHLASEHDLEFVDLDIYGVDPAASEILPSGSLVSTTWWPSSASSGRRSSPSPIPMTMTGTMPSEKPSDVTSSLWSLPKNRSLTTWTVCSARRAKGTGFGKGPQGEEAGWTNPLEAPRTSEAEALGRNLVELNMEELETAEHGSNGKANGIASNGLVDASGLGGHDELSSVGVIDRCQSG